MEATPWHAQVEPVLLQYVRAKRFEVTFSVTRDGTSTPASAGFVFNYKGPGEFDVIEVHHKATSNTAPQAYVHQHGKNRVNPGGTQNSAYLNTPTSKTDKVWYRIVCVEVSGNDYDLFVYSGNTPGELATNQSNGYDCFVYTGTQFAFSGDAGQLGFVALDDTAYIDDVTIKTDPDGDADDETDSSTFNNTVASETFDLATGGKVENGFIYDDAGKPAPINLVYTVTALYEKQQTRTSAV